MRRHHRAHAPLVDVADRLETGDELDAALEVHHVLGALPQPVQVVDGVEHRQVAVGLTGPRQLLGRAGEQQPVQGVAALLAGPGEDLPVLVVQLGLRARRLAALQSLGTEGFRPSAGRVAELAGEERDDRVGDVELVRSLGELRRVGAGRHEVQGEVADDLGRRGDLHQPAEDAVGRGVHRLDLLELLTEPERDRLLAQVRQLSPGDLVVVHAPGGAGQPRLERRVNAAYGLPVRLQVHHGA